MCCARYMTIARFCELTGYTPATVYTRKSKGIWRQGIWIYEPGTKKLLIDLHAFEAYVESRASRGGKSPTLPPLEPPEPRRRSKPGIKVSNFDTGEL